jgi:hypothetical protein
VNLTRGDIHWIDLPDRDPKGAEIEKRRPCVILSLIRSSQDRGCSAPHHKAKGRAADPDQCAVGGRRLESRLRPDSGCRQEARSREGRVAFTKRHETPRGERQPRVGVVIRNSRSGGCINHEPTSEMYANSLVAYISRRCLCYWSSVARSVGPRAAGGSDRNAAPRRWPPRRAPSSLDFRVAPSIRPRVDHADPFAEPIFLFLSPFAPTFKRRSSRAGLPSAPFALNRG